MRGPKLNLCVQSWIPPDVVWVDEPDLFCVEVPANDPDISKFVSAGDLDVEVPAHGPVFSSKDHDLLVSGGLIQGSPLRSLRAQIEEAAWMQDRLKPKVNRPVVGTNVVAHCHGVFLLPGEESACALVGWARPRTSTPGFASSSKINSGALVSDQQSADILLSALPRATTFSHGPSTDQGELVRLAIPAIAESNLAPSRDGSYVVILAGPVGQEAKAIVSWVPHAGAPSYPEVRWAVQRRLSAALRKPRVEQLPRPASDAGGQAASGSTQIRVADPNNLREALEDLRLDQRDLQRRVNQVRDEARRRGFEAIAWFQPFHVWDEKTWGIYFDSSKLDDLACSFRDDFASRRIRGANGLAALLAFGLTYAHELFHAEVEAAVSWQELNALRPRYLRYQRRVYEPLRETPEWLEEALANWSAWEWFHSEATQAVLARMSAHPKELESIVEASLDLSPPGYQEWRRGSQVAIRRAFATQLATGRPKTPPPGVHLPVEGVLFEQRPYDFEATDVPLHFIGHGAIADRLLNHPATFNVPPRRELERALRHFKLVLDPAGGKGSHEKWTGPDRRAFMLPMRDPVSPIVFKKFLSHVGIDKGTYVKDVRPKL